MRKCLYLSYYFPPSGGSGVQRTLKMSRYLPDAGWTPTVVTVDPDSAAYPSIDRSLLAEVPESLDVRRTGAWDPYAAYGRLLGKKKDSVVSIGFSGEGRPSIRQTLARFVRANLFIPDARVGWVPFAKAELGRLVQTGQFEVLVSSGPPHSTHLAARRVARRYGIPWVVDMRDPWTEIYYYGSLPTLPPAKALDRRLEQAVYREASAIVVVSPSMKARLEERGVTTPIFVIPNGYDPDDFRTAAPRPQPLLIRHVGSLGPTQSTGALAEALDGIADAASRRFEVSFVGSTDPLAVEPLLRSRLADRISLDDVVAHDVAIRRMREAGVLLLVIPKADGAEAIVTGKLPEYIASGRVVLGIGPADGDAARILSETGAGEMFEWSDADGIRRFLEAYASEVAAGELPSGAQTVEQQKYSRPEQARALAAVLDRVSERGGSA